MVLPFGNLADTYSVCALDIVMIFTEALRNRTVDLVRERKTQLLSHRFHTLLETIVLNSSGEVTPKNHEVEVAEGGFIKVAMLK